MDKKAMENDLIEIYEALYPLIRTSAIQTLFNAKLIKRFKYTPEEVREILLAPESKEVKKEKKEKKEVLRDEIANITQVDELRDYYYNSLSLLFSEKEGTQSLNMVTLAELKYLNSIISNVPIQSRKTKTDLYYMIKNYFDNEARTQDMMKNL